MSPIAVDAAAICSRCGYDLRGIDSERCPECGFELANQRTLGGEIPWTYRRPRGAGRAFVETVIKVCSGGPWLRRVTSADLSLREARLFWLIASVVASLPLVGAFVFCWIHFGSLEPFVYMPDAMMIGMNSATFGMSSRWDEPLAEWIRGDLVWPLAAGYTRPGLPIVVLPLFMLLGSGATTYLFHPRSLTGVHRQRACALAYYLCAPLVIAAVPLACLIASVFYIIGRASQPMSPPTLMAMLSFVAWAAVLALYAWRLLQALRLTTHASTTRLVVSAMFIPIGWIAAGVFALLFVPWCVGYAWLLLDVLR